MSYKLVYLPISIRGRVQPLRYLCEDNDIPLEEERINLVDLPSYKPKTPLGQVPVLYDGTFEVAQTNAILRYVAKKHGLYGKDDQEAALIDMINDQQQDSREIFYRFVWQNVVLGLCPSTPLGTGIEEYIRSIPNHLKPLEKILGRNKEGKEFFVGDKISFADYSVFDQLDNFLVLSSSALDGFPLLKAFHARMASREKIAKYRENDAFKNSKICGNNKP